MEQGRNSYTTCTNDPKGSTKKLGAAIDLTWFWKTNGPHNPAEINSVLHPNHCYIVVEGLGVKVWMLQPPEDLRLECDGLEGQVSVVFTQCHLHSMVVQAVKIEIRRVVKLMI